MLHKKKPVKLVNPNLFEDIYNIAKAKNPSQARVDWLLNTSFNIDVKVAGMTPAAVLAQEGNHEAVRMLLSHGASAKPVVEAYKAAGFFNSPQKASQVFDGITDARIRDLLAEEASKIVAPEIILSSRYALSI